jgi:hypothetical protein
MMEIGYAFFAEAVQLTADGRVNILGADIPRLQFSGQPPWALPNVFLLVSFTLGREDCGRLFDFTADLFSPDEVQLDPHIESTFLAPVPEEPDLQARMTITLQISNMVFIAPGAYHMRVKAEDRERGTQVEKRVRLRIVGPLAPASTPAH